MTNTNRYPACQLCELAPFCNTDRHVKLKRGETLTWSSDKFQNLYAIKQGAIKTFQTEMSGNELIRGFYFLGEVLGYEAINTGYYPFSAVALCDTELCEIPFESILELLKTNVKLQRYILDLLSKQLTHGHYLQSSAEQRLAAFLIDLAERLNADKTKPEFHLPMSRHDIGNYLRLTGETVSRICSRLTGNKIILAEHKKVQLLDPATLKDISNGIKDLT